MKQKNNSHAPTKLKKQQVLPKIRFARVNEINRLEKLIERSVMELQSKHYSLDQRRGALGTVFGVDRQLIHDGTYYVAEIGSELVACGGWSRRKTLFGSDAIAGKDDNLLDPQTEPARIRAFFVDPAWARRGIGSQILDKCQKAAQACGFTHFELVATLTGEALYRISGFAAVERYDVPLPNGLQLSVVRMAKPAEKIG